ncbi:MAG: GGDEF domain-containing protein, partial [Bdellovibrionales bacterium]
VLVATMVHGVGDVEWANAGIDFNEAREGFRSTQLRDPLAIEELGDLLHGIFGATEFFPNTVETLGEVQGVVCFLCPTPPPTTELQVQDWLMLLGKALSLVEAERRLHVVSTHDSATGLLTRQHFLNRISQEVSRARRTSTPVSLALMAVDQYGAVVSQFGPDDAQVILRMVARIFEKHSRVNDIVGRTGTDEFGILLPHTGRRGALIKAERLRRIIESADFSRVLKSFPQLTISIGVAEYPSMSRDADELLQTADEALYQVRGEGNKTCVAKPPEGFTPDFVVADKGPE